MTGTSPPRPLRPRLERERRTIAAMVRIHCRDRHGTRDGICAECQALVDYAGKRLRVCPFHEDKPVCNKCAVHCYAPALRERVREVMRYAGPRMLCRHPWLAVLHLLDTLRPAPEPPRKRRAARAFNPSPESSGPRHGQGPDG